MAKDVRSPMDETTTSQIPHVGPVTGTGSLEAALEHESHVVKRLLKTLGPGLITGASDDDPSGIGTYATAGASLGFATLWTAPITLPLMAAVQFICAKIGMVSGMGLAGVLRQHYSRRVLYPAILCLIVANTINAGADLGAIAAAINLLVPIPVGVLIVPIALVIVGLQIWGSYRLIARVFKWLTLALFAYIGAAFFARPDLAQVLRATFIPSFRADNQYLLTLVAILGTTISPYLFFWQASEEVEEEVSMGRVQLRERQGATKAELKYARLDVIIGMFFANLVFYFVILASAATLNAAGKTNIQSATEAAQALRPLAGNAASVLFAIGLAGSGLLAVPVLVGSSAYAVCESFGWQYGLDKKPRGAKHFYVMIVVSIAIGSALNYLGINPINALVWTAVINGLLAPPLLVVIMFVANNKQVMGEHTNGAWANALGGLATLAMFAAAGGLLLTWI